MTNMCCTVFASAKQYLMSMYSCDFFEKKKGKNQKRREETLKKNLKKDGRVEKNIGNVT